MKKFALFLIWILSIVSCEKLDEKESKGFGKLDGHAYIADKTRPASGYGVNLPGYGVQIINSEGHFGYSQVFEGKYTLSVTDNAGHFYPKDVEIQKDKTAFVEVILPDTRKDLSDFTPIDLSNESTHTWDYQVVGKEEYFYIDVENSLPKSALYHSFKTGKDYGITFDSKGLPSRVTSPDGSILLFSNFNGNKVDLGILSPSGESQIIREIKTDFTWPTSSKSPQSRADVIRWTGRILGAIPCVASAATAVATGGFATYLAIWTCGNYFLSMADNFFDDANVENGFTKFVDDYKLTSTAYTCTTNPDLSSCLIALAQRGLSSYADYVEEMDEKEDVLRIVEASLHTGYGDIQVTLTWDNTSDLDLHVIDPFGEEIYWYHKNSASGGILDYDNMDGYGPENVYWPKSKAPNGTYQVLVHDFAWVNKPSSANYIVSINAFGKTKQFSGSINLNETKGIANFDENSINSAKSGINISNITIKPKVRKN